ESWKVAQITPFLLTSVRPKMNVSMCSIARHGPGVKSRKSRAGAFHGASFRSLLGEPAPQRPACRKAARRSNSPCMHSLVCSITGIQTSKRALLCRQARRSVVGESPTWLRIFTQVPRQSVLAVLGGEHDEGLASLVLLWVLRRPWQTY